MNEVYNTHGRDQKYVRKVSQKRCIGSDGLRSLGMDGNMILKLILDWGGGLPISDASQGPVTGCCKHGRKPTRPTDGREYLFFWYCDPTHHT